MHTERQGHGFTFEEYVEKYYHVDRSKTTYTGQWDGTLNGHPVSIKHIKKGNAVDCADLFRQASVDKDFYMFVDFYETPTVSETDELHILYVPCQAWRSYFLPLNQFEQKFRDALAAVTNDKADDAKWDVLRKDCVNFWKKNTSQIITVNGKRDHKKQKRWQCSINQTNFRKEILPKYEITEDELNAQRNQE